MGNRDMRNFVLLANAIHTRAKEVLSATDIEKSPNIINLSPHKIRPDPYQPGYNDVFDNSLLHIKIGLIGKMPINFSPKGLCSEFVNQIRVLESFIRAL